MNSNTTNTTPSKPRNLIGAIVLAYTGLIYMIGHSLYTQFPAMNEDQRIIFVITYGITLCVCYYVTTLMLQGNILARKVALLIAGVALIFTLVNIFSSPEIEMNLTASIFINLTIIVLLRSRPVATWFKPDTPTNSL